MFMLLGSKISQPKRDTDTKMKRSKALSVKLELDIAA